jgi:hypothetical protein
MILLEELLSYSGLHVFREHLACLNVGDVRAFSDCQNGIPATQDTCNCSPVVARPTLRQCDRGMRSRLDCEVEGALPLLVAVSCRRDDQK